MKLHFQNLKLTVAVTLAFVSLVNTVPAVQSETDPVPPPDVLLSPTQKSDRLIFTQLEASRRGAPGRRRGGGTFGGGNQCKGVTIPLTALVPGEEKVGSLDLKAESVRGLTAEGYPTFWFFVPYGEASKLDAELVLVNDQNKPVYQELVPLTGTPGIVKISSKRMSAPLEVGKDYRWSFSVICNPQESSANFYVQGRVKRIEPSPNLTRELKTATPEQKVFLYAQEGLWYETVTTIREELSSTNPQKATLLMTNLLQSVGLDDIAQQPFVPCCTHKK